jgi:adenosine deaminase
MEDPALVAYLARTQLPLTVCPLSNVKLGILPDLKHHNVPQLLAAGLRATVNSDDPAYFGGYVGDNFLAVKDALQLTDVQLVGLARNSFLASFITAGERQRYLARLEAAYAQHQTEPV